MENGNSGFLFLDFKVILFIIITSKYILYLLLAAVRFWGAKSFQNLV